ncbi:hypothetical protein CD113_09600 [Staphylococcus simiae]|uniref:Uncharacterized protein n=1 Tax=Staphylococcus simiae CCM 7213 = CCUG 51256 TaxID=911238 RepID=G5JJ42_9STAP|nr:hypothetical protein SS7213T_07453 [Staphylococcus simiae CCM 7213 = CCUG 51256]PNZ10884.1 hypothetical protein CD113_09600 [Staphylococcus simiae]SNV61419.1 Uncharacterised protein [Staphylococcus simiae]
MCILITLFKMTDLKFKGASFYINKKNDDTSSNTVTKKLLIKRYVIYKKITKSYLKGQIIFLFMLKSSY